MKIKLSLLYENKLWKNENDITKNNICAIIKATLDNTEAFKNVKTVEIAVVLSDDDHSQRLNNEFLGKNYPTNVLSFPDNEIHYTELLEFSQNKDYIYIGDILMSYNIVKSESVDLGLSFYEHFTHLLIHGTLHLVGYDHQINTDEKIMMELETKVLKQFNIESPY
jgi:probable rRNA maturation factor